MSLAEPLPPKPPDPAWREFARAPLVPVALAATAGLVADRTAPIPWTTSLLVGVAAFTAWLIARHRRTASAAVWLWLGWAALAAMYHHLYRNSYAPDDIAVFVPDRPTPVRVRGTLDEEPIRLRTGKPDPLRTVPRTDTTVSVLAVSAVETRGGWTAASGRARLTVDGDLTGVHVGDSVETVGRLARPDGPSNPGEWDYRGHLLDQRVTADLHVRRTPDGVTRLQEGWRATLFGWVAAVRGWGTRTLQEALPPREAATAAALLLGDTAAMDRAEWDVYVQTGVVHVLAISGQHLVVLAGFAWLVLRVFGVRSRQGAWAVLLLMVGYTLLTGSRPSAVRAAVMVGILCGGTILRRRVITANAFALAWLVVAVITPTDPFTAGCQLSFLSVFVLVWFAGPLLKPRERTAIEQLIDETRGPVEKAVRSVARWAWSMFLVSLILGVANAPLLLAWQNIVSPVGVVLGPPLIVLTSIALIAGFLLLLVSPLGPWVGLPFAKVTAWSLEACEWLAHFAARIPEGWVYAPGPAAWWLVGFYAFAGAAVLLAGRARFRALAALAVWTAFGLAIGTHRPTADELRLTFLAVGDGGCVVIETPDGRVLVYDAGTQSGPDVVRRTVAPYLWSRGISRIDEVFISHADLDHFNGLPALLDRFPVGRVTLTPSFRDKPTPGVEATLAAIDRRGIPTRTVQVGDRFTAGDVQFEVLHPPPAGLEAGNENTRSLVLRVTHAGHTVLLTGDLEGAGQDAVRKTAIPPADVMLAPHHGALGANYPQFAERDEVRPGLMAAWARPRLVVSSQRADRGTAHLLAAYGTAGATVWDTATVGAVTARSHATGLVAETFRTGEVKVIRRGGK